MSTKKNTEKEVENAEVSRTTFLLNKLLFSTVNNELAVEPFQFEISIEKLDGMTLTRVDINGAEMRNSDVIQDPNNENKLIGKIKAIVALRSFLLDIDVVGRPFTSTGFTLKCNDKEVFPNAQQIEIDSRGMGGYFNKTVPLP